MITVAVLIPVLNRPDRAAVVAQSIRNSDKRATPVFLCSPGDDAEIDACVRTGERIEVVPWEPGPGDWAKKCDYGFKATDDEWKLLGADDLSFHGGWFEQALGTFQRTKCCVIGTNDLGNPRVIGGHHSTHPLVNIGYLQCGTIDETGKLLHFGYHHQFVDDEFVQTAMVRRSFAMARTSYVEHLHPHWNKGHDDETYRKGMAGFNHDHALFERRKGLWLR